MLDIRELPIDQVQAAPYNPRRPLRPGDPGWQRLQRSLDEFDLVEPLVWNEQTGHLVGGHQRLAILRERGATHVPVVVVALPLEREKALNIALNNPNVGGDWDLPQLTELLEELHDLPDVDATLTGFSDDELRQLIWEPPPEEIADDESEPVAATVGVRLEVPLDDWNDVRPQLDRLLQSFPEIGLHVERGAV